MIIAFANDHAAAEVRAALLEHIRNLGHEVIDCGHAGTDSVDYPDVAAKAIEHYESGRADRVVLVCGSGVGMSIAANRHPQIRCVLATDTWAAGMARAHNDANALALRARNQDPKVNEAILRAFLETAFEGGRHQRRIAKLSSPLGSHPLTPSEVTKS
jgi:ribose 5-phosphate isomerase B